MAKDDGTDEGARVPAEAPVSAPKPSGTAEPASNAANEDPSYDPAVLTVIAVDIDTKLAAMCSVDQSKGFFKFDSANLLPAAKERLDGRNRSGRTPTTSNSA